MKLSARIVVVGILVDFLAFSLLAAEPAKKRTESALKDRDSFGGWTEVKGKQTEYFHTEQINERWWLISPAGNAFFSKGVNSINQEGNADPRTGKPIAINKQVWAEATAAQLKGWGVNSAGCWSAPELGAQGLAYCLRPHLTGSHGGELPDVFDPNWAANVKKLALEECRQYRSDPWLIGYFTDNELKWEHEDKAQDFLKHFLAMPAGSPGRKAADDFVRSHGNDQADGFRHTVAVAYFRVTAEAIRAVDPNHLILGCRFAGHPPMSVVGAMKGNADVISLNNYSDKPPISLLRDMSKAAGLPVMVTEWSVKGKDSGPLTAHGSGPVVATQADRAEHYQKYVEQLADLNCCVGFHWFRYCDHPGSNQGLVNTKNEPWTPLTKQFEELNPKLDQRHNR